MYLNKISLDSKCHFTIVIICFLMLFPNISFGKVICEQISSQILVNTTLSPINISAGTDLPLGTVIYRGDTRQSSDIPNIIKCDGEQNEKFFYTYKQQVIQAPLPLSSWQGKSYGGKVYQSGIPGIGIVIVAGNGEAITHLNPVTTINTNNKLSSSGSLSFTINNASTRLLLIKIGEFSPGTYMLNASNLPIVQHIIDNSPGNPVIITSPIGVFKLSFSGGISVNSNTCITPDANVSMGNYNINKDFSDIGSTTQWVDVNLILKDCPIFYGFYDDSNYPIFYDANNGGIISIPASIANVVGVRLDPNTLIINSSLGIMSIDSDNPSSASGVNIQLGWGDKPVAFDFFQEKKLSLPKDGRSSFRLPLFARYIKTDPIITPGRADGRLTFTINYY